MDAARVNVKGVLAPVSKEERADVKKLFLDRHPGSYWVRVRGRAWVWGGGRGVDARVAWQGRGRRVKYVSSASVLAQDIGPEAGSIPSACTSASCGVQKDLMLSAAGGVW